MRSLKFKKLTSTEYSEIKELLSIPRNIVITSHSNPDGDAMGAPLALYGLLKQMNHRTHVVIPDEPADFLRWMPDYDKVIAHSKQPEEATRLFESADVVFCVDFNSPERTAGLSEILKKAKAKKILIDHHLGPENFCDYLLSEPQISSTTELLFDFIENIGWKQFMNKDIAACIYVGILTDTGSFSYSVNDPNTYLIVAELIKYGIDCHQIYNNIYSTFTEDRMRLLGFCLSAGLHILSEYNAAYIRLSKEDQKKYNYKIGDTEGIVNYPLAIGNIKLSALFLEKEDTVKISFRSKGSFSADEFARTNFKGGGHLNASGGNCELSLDETIEKFKSVLPVYKSELNKS